MNNLNDKYYLVYNQTEQFYLFELEPSGNLIYKIFDKKMNLMDKYFISDNDILCFGLTLDENSRINLVYLQESGDLYLCINDGLEWTKSLITTLDIKSNIYHQFEILHLNSQINIVYSFSNYINSEIISIYHLVLDGGAQKQIKAIKYILRKGYDEFSFGFDKKGIIHLLYNTNTKFESYIYYSFYNPYRGNWTPNPKELSTRNLSPSNPYIFIDSRSNVHTAWLEMEKDYYRLKYAKMPVIGKEKYMWKNVNLSLAMKNRFTPIIYESNGVLKILSYDNESIVEINSNDFGDKWSNGKIQDIENSCKFIRFVKADNIYRDLVINNLLVKNPNIEELSDLYIDSYFTDETSQEYISKPSEIKSNLDDEFEDKEPNQELGESEQSNKIPIDMYEIKSMLNQVLENQESMINEINCIKNIKFDRKPSFLDRIFKG